MLDDLWTSVLALNRRFPKGGDPFKAITRLAEEVGELATEVQLREGEGVKAQKLGAPDDAKTAKEVMDVMRAALQLAVHYGLEDALLQAIDKAVSGALAEGLVTEAEVAANRSR